MFSEASLARRLERKLQARVPRKAGTRLASDEEALRDALGPAKRPGPCPASSSGVDAAILEALIGPYLLHVLHRRRRQDIPGERVLAPQRLLFEACRYLVARNTTKADDASLQHYREE